MADPGLPRRGSANLKWEVPAYYLAKISENCIKMKEIRPRGVSSLDLSLVRQKMRPIDDWIAGVRNSWFAKKTNQKWKIKHLAKRGTSYLNFQFVFNLTNYNSPVLNTRCTGNIREVKLCSKVSDLSDPPDDSTKNFLSFLSFVFLYYFTRKTRHFQFSPFSSFWSMRIISLDINIFAPIFHGRNQEIIFLSP